MLRSRPQSLAFPAGTTSSSADRKSSSSISYFSRRIASTCAFTRSFSSFFASSGLSALSSFPESAFFIGRLPINRFRSSPSITTLAFFANCSPARWTNRSVIQKTGSPSSSPMLTSTTEPSFLATTPCRDMGLATHWYFLIPP